jgi:hypothetical protein
LSQPRISNQNDAKQLLASANYFYWLHNLPKSAPLYQRAEEIFAQNHGERNTLYATIGRIRSGDQMPFPELSKFLEGELMTPLVQRDPALRLWCLGVKGDADDELNVGAEERRFAATLYPMVQESIRDGIYPPHRSSPLCSRKHCGYWRQCEREFGGRVPD